jgi:hypothetical protein
MRHFLLGLLLQLLAVQMLYAQPVTLSCIQTDGTNYKLVVDVAKRTMKLNLSEYDIHHVDDEYISAYQKVPSRFVVDGGEVWMMNRATGQFKRAIVGTFCRGALSPDCVQQLDAIVTEGRCSKQQF